MCVCVCALVVSVRTLRCKTFMSSLFFFFFFTFAWLTNNIGVSDKSTTMASNLVPRDEFAKNGTGSGSKPFGGKCLFECVCKEGIKTTAGPIRVN